MNNISKTLVFFIMSVYLLLAFWLSGFQVPRWSIILSYAVYVIFFILNFKNIKIRFLAYPFVILNIFLGWYSFTIQDFSGVSNQVGFGYVGMWIFILIVIPAAGIALILGGIFDVIDIIKHRRKIEDQNQQDELVK